jgi:hypothetical protein
MRLRNIPSFWIFKVLGLLFWLILSTCIVSVNVYAGEETNPPLTITRNEVSDSIKAHSEPNAPLQSIINTIELNLTKTNLDAKTRQQLEATLKRFQTLANSQAQVQSNYAIAVARGGLPPSTISPERVPSSPWIMSSKTNIANTNFTNVIEQAPNSSAPHDVMGDWLSKMIDSTKKELERPDLDTNMRQRLEWKLKQLAGQLADHQMLIQSNTDFAKAMRSNPRSALTNMADPILQTWSSIVERNERELADPALDPYKRQALETIVANAKQQLADHQTNAQLWANLVQDEISRNTQQAERDKAKLADYLAARLGKVQGKAYTQGMSLEAVMAEYQKQANGSHWFNRQSTIRVILLVIFLAPPLAMIFIALKRRFSKPS